MNAASGGAVLYLGAGCLVSSDALAGIYARYDRYHLVWLHSSKVA